MKSNEAFPSTYLKAPDLNGQRPVVTITHVTTEDLGGDTKRAVHFKGTDKVLICNRTNWNTIAEIAGKDDDDEWAGTKIQLYSTKVDFQGKRVDALRVCEPPSTSKSAAAAKGKPAKPPVVALGEDFQGDDSDLGDDAIPF